MYTSPPASLLRLREADIVRLCGFGAAAEGLALAARHAVTAGRRVGARLSALVGADPPAQTEVELADEITPAAMRWTCSCQPDAPAGMVGCAHVAATLSAWLRAPGDFAADHAMDQRPPSASVEASPQGILPPPQARVSQPALMRLPGTPRPVTSGRLADELARMPVTSLLAIARRVLGEDLSEHEAREGLLAALTDSQRLTALIARLGEAPQTLWATVLLLGGAMTTAEIDGLAARQGQAPSALHAALATLTRYALLFPATGMSPRLATREVMAETSVATGAPKMSLGWRIPVEIRAVASPTAPLAPLPTRDGQGPPLLSLGGETPQQRPARVERASLRPLLLALTLLARAPRPLGPYAARDSESSARAEAPSRTNASVSAIAPGDLAPTRLEALARVAGLEPSVARLARRVLLWAREEAPGQPLTDLARVPPGERVAALTAGFRLWSATESAADLVDLNETSSPVRWRCDPSHSAFRPSLVAAEATAARQFLLALLRAGQPQAWYRIHDLLDLIWRIHPLFLRSRQQAHAAPVWWFERAEGDRCPLRSTEREEWLAGEGVYLRALLTGPLHWWGVTDLATDSTGAPIAARVTSMGRALLARPTDHPLATGAISDTSLDGEWGPPALGTRDGNLAVQPLATGAEYLGALEEWAEPVAVTGGRLVYALSPDRACAAFDRGYTPSALLDSLRQADPRGGERIAQQIGARLAQWQGRYGEARIDHGWTLFEARDELTLVEALAAAPDVATRCRRLSATIALAREEDAAVLRAALARRGYAL